jgi:TFIIF-interacting CTD phosphatase-like protein
MHTGYRIIYVRALNRRTQGTEVQGTGEWTREPGNLRHTASAATTLRTLFSFQLECLLSGIHG